MPEMSLIDSARSKYEDVQKLVFKDEDVLEVSYIRKGDGKDIVCVPTQTSCNMGCQFCHLTGMGVKAKNLDSDRIVRLVEKSLEIQPPANKTLLVSFMGAGEPLLNVDNIVFAAEEIRRRYTKDDRPLMRREGYEKVRFAVSTILPSRKVFDHFVEEVNMSGLDFKLHFSLHSLENEKRSLLMPSASEIDASLAMVEEWTQRTGLPAEIHYTLMDGVNDRAEDIGMFAARVGRGATIKLLRFAEKDSEPDLKRSVNVGKFALGLEAEGFKVEIYSPPGHDVGSSCGQFILDQYVS